MFGFFKDGVINMPSLRNYPCDLLVGFPKDMTSFFSSSLLKWRVYHGLCVTARTTLCVRSLEFCLPETAPQSTFEHVGNEDNC